MRNVKDNSVSTHSDGEIVLSTTNTILLPKGNTAQRPISPTPGHMRYNTDSNEIEVYQGASATWKPLSYKIPRTIVVQSFGPGDAVETKYGPLNSQWSSTYIAAGYGDYTAPASPNNIFVIVDNVIQIPNTNFILQENPLGYTAGTYVSFSTPVPLGKSITVMHGFD